MSTHNSARKESPSCPKCGNRLRVRADLMGTEVRCPKCQAVFTLGGKPNQPADEAPVDEDDQYEPEIPLKKSFILPVEEMIDIGPQAAMQPIYEERYEASEETGDELEAEAPIERPVIAEDYLALAESKGLIRKRRVVTPPKWTFFSGVFSFPWRGANVGRWLGMSFGLVMTSWLLVTAGSFMAGGVNMGTLALPMLSMFCAISTLLSLAFCAPCFLAAIQDTSDGQDEIQEATMPDWDHWFLSLLSLASVTLVAGSLGIPFSFIEPIGPWAIPICLVIFFPVFVLSAMECQSFLLPFSSLVWGSLARNAFSWMAFHLVADTMLATWYVLTVLALRAAPYLVMLLAAPALAAAMLIYARLLGRLAWRISGASAPGERITEAASEAEGPARRPRRRQRRRRWEVPESFDLSPRE